MGKKRPSDVGNSARIASALWEIYPDKGFDYFIADRKCNSVSPESCVWAEVCQKISPCKDIRTLEKNVRRCYSAFHDKLDEIRTIFIEKSRACEHSSACSQSFGNGQSIDVVRSNSHDDNDNILELENWCFSKNAVRGIVNPSGTIEEKLNDVPTGDPNVNTSDQHDKIVVESESHHAGTVEVVSEDISQEYVGTGHIKMLDDNENIIVLENDQFSGHFWTPRKTSESETTDAFPRNEELESYDTMSSIVFSRDAAKLKSVTPSLEDEGGTCVHSEINTTPKITETFIEDESVVVPSSFWSKYWSSKRKLHRGWTDAFVDYVQSVPVYRLCVFVIKYHRCYPADEKHQNYFYAAAKCKNSHCTSYKFRAVEKIQSPFEDVTVKVWREKEISHIGSEIHRRFIKGEKREKISKELELERPSVLRSLKIQNVSEEVLEAGNRDDAPSLQLLQKMSSEIETKKDLDPHPIIHLEKLAKKYRNDPTWSSTICPGYIQYHFNSMAFTEKQIQYLLSISPKTGVICNLDSTGSVVATMPESENSLFYYALILPGNQEYGPLPIAEFLSERHTVPYITFFLSTFNHAVRQFTTRKVVIKKIETDMSIALIASCLRAFNDLTINGYSLKIYSTLCQGFETIPEITFVHVCSSHLLKTVLRKAKKIMTEKQQLKLVALVTTQLIHCTTMEAAEASFKMVAIIFGLEYHVPEQDNYMRNLLSGKNVYEADEFDEAHDDDDHDRSDILLKDDVETTDDELTGRKGSPFYTFFHEIYEKVLEKFGESTDKLITKKDMPKNPLYSNAFVYYLLEYMLPYYAFWSAIVISKLNLRRDSNASVENYFKIVKSIIFKKKLRITAPRFFRKMESLIGGWLLERKYSLVTDRQRRNKKSDDPNRDDDDESQATEQWKPKKPKKRKSNIYFPAQKHIRIERNEADVERKLKEPSEERITESQIVVEEIGQELPLEEKSDEESTAENYDSFNQDIAERFFTDTAYPSKFPNLTKDFGGIPLTPTIFERLLPDKYIDGEIINSFFVALQDVSQRNGLNLLAFDTYFTTKLMSGEKSIGFNNWAKKVQPVKYDIWMLPVLVNENHWTLLVILFQHRVMVYFDSCHHLPPKSLINRICQFIGSSRSARQAKLTNWSQWELSAPTDIPHQMTEDGGIGGNCGMHLCMWAYTIVSSSMVPFQEEQMNLARKGLTKFLLNFPISRRILESLRTKDAMFDSYDVLPGFLNVVGSMRTSRSPPLNFTSTLEFAASIKVLSEIANVT